MVQLRTQRTALILYGVLLVLPTVVLGGLQWHQLLRDYESEAEAIPHNADNVAGRLRGAIGDRLAQLIRSEHRRVFTEYGDTLITSDANLAEATPVTSPLVTDPRPAAILAWFTLDLRKGYVSLWGGAGARESELQAQYLQPLRQLLKHYLPEEQPGIIPPARWDTPEPADVALLKIVHNQLHQRDPDCLQEDLALLAQYKVQLHITPFHVEYFEDARGIPRLVATRKLTLNGPVVELGSFSACFDSLQNGMSVVQGFLIDPDWFFRDLPAQVAKTVLDSSQRFVGPDDPPCCGGDPGLEYHVPIVLLGDLGIETHEPEQKSHARMLIAVDTQAIDSKYQTLRLRFLGLAAMLAVSLSTGMWLLLRSVRKDLEQATRTENFVAAVTHELRTPLTSIKMYGEMLLDGEGTPGEKQREYYKRIVRATERLGTLVERVLEKSRLSAGSVRAEPGDLNDVIRGLERQLAQYGPEGDLAFDLDPDLPDVLLTQEATTSIVSNLVENARKYAPVDPAVPGAEPILVRTRRHDGEVLLEVLDRGPGVPEGEREKIFEAFYRVGTEATRTARGAGLGLHLVLLQARSIGGDAGYRAREGGGSIFWTSFAPAPRAA